MARGLFFFLGLFFISDLFAQESIRISGCVVDSQKPGKRIYALKARLTFNDTLFFDTDVDSTGNYVFQISPKWIRSFVTKVSIEQDQKQLRALFAPEKVECGSLASSPDRYMSPRPLRIDPSGTPGNYACNFQLTKILSCGPGPELCFKKSSLEFSREDRDNPDEVLCWVRKLLVDNPGIIIRIDAHAYGEKHCLQLSAARAEKLRDTLITFGIKGDRINAVGNGDKRPLITKRQISKCHTKEEKEKLRAANRRLSFTILSFDYDLQAKPSDEADD